MKATESIYFYAFRAYENFIRDIFLLYYLGKKPKSGQNVRCFLNPRNFAHAESLIKSAMPFLDWTNPSTVINRSELYLSNGYPIKGPYTSYLEKLMDFKRIRNHIAHNSIESLEEYKKVIRKYFGSIPLNVPIPGEYLLKRDRVDNTKYILQIFFETLKKISIELT